MIYVKFLFLISIWFVNSDVLQVFSAKNVAEMRMIDDGFEERAKERKKQKLKMLAEKGLLKKKIKGENKVKNFQRKGKR